MKFFCGHKYNVLFLSSVKSLVFKVRSCFLVVCILLFVFKILSHIIISFSSSSHHIVFYKEVLIIIVKSFVIHVSNLLFAVDKVETLKRYKFSFAFENSNEEDYVTEKYFQSLVAGMKI